MIANVWVGSNAKSRAQAAVAEEMSNAALVFMYWIKLLVRFRIFLNLVFMVWDHLFRSIYNIFNFIIAGGGEGCKFEVGN